MGGEDDCSGRIGVKRRALYPAQVSEVMHQVLAAKGLVAARIDELVVLRYRTFEFVDGNLDSARELG